MAATAARKPAPQRAVRTGRARRPRPPIATQARADAPVPALTTASSARCVSACIHAYSGASTAS